MVREVLETPIVGTVPAIRPAAALSQTGVIGVLGTQATVRQAYVDRLVEQAGLPEPVAALLASFGTAIRLGFLSEVSTAVADLTGIAPAPLSSLLG